MRSCLVVDDSRVVRMVARRILEQLGFATAEAANGQEALDACGTRLPDAVLLDWNMPVMNGLDFLLELRSKYGKTGPKVVFCTTENSMASIRAALEAGADDYIMKPFDRDILEAQFSQAGLL